MCTTFFLDLCNTFYFFTRSFRPYISKFPSISDLLSLVSMFQHHKNLCPNCNISLVSSFNLSSAGVKSVLQLETLMYRRVLCMTAAVYCSVVYMCHDHSDSRHGGKEVTLFSTCMPTGTILALCNERRLRGLDKAMASSVSLGRI